MPTKAHDRLVRSSQIREKNKGRRGLRQRPVRWQFPDLLERQYQRAVQKATNDINRFINQTIVKELPSLVRASQAKRSDNIRHDASWPARLKQLITSAQVFGIRRMSEIDVRAFVRKVTFFNKTQRNRVIKSVLGVDMFVSEPWLTDMQTLWVNQNRKLIKSIPQRHLDDLEGIITRGLGAGSGIKDITGQIRQRYGVSEARARLIGRDQIAKLNGQLTEQRQTQLGVTHFIWETVGDERVRESHAEFNQKRYSWETGAGPDGLIPGQDYQCRCIASPDLSHLLEELADDPDVLEARREKGLEMIGYYDEK